MAYNVQHMLKLIANALLRKMRDSNPRYPKRVYRISSPAHSVTLPIFLNNAKVILNSHISNNSPSFFLRAPWLHLRQRRSYPTKQMLLEDYYNVSHSLIHKSAEASLGIRQSPRGLRLILPTLGPSGRHERLNC